MVILKWFSFIVFFLDFVEYIIKKARKVENVGTFIGFILGILCRAFVLYGTVTCWLLS